MNVLLSNPWLFLAIVIWVICGIVAIVQKVNEALEFACVASFALGVVYVYLHQH